MKAKSPIKARRSSRVSKAESEDTTETTETPTASGSSMDQEAIARGGVATPFPWKLHEMLEDAAKENNESIVSWCPHGRSFIVHKPKIFVEKVMPTYFNQSKFASFQRQLNLYGFHRITTGKDKGAYYHSCFVRGQVGLCKGMVRQKIKGTKVRRTLAPGEEPDFYKMASNESFEEHHHDAAPVKEEPAGEEEEVEPQVPEEARKHVLASKERAHKIRQQERLNAVRDALKQTEMICREDDEDDVEFDDALPTVSYKDIPSVSPLESEVDTDDDSSIFSAERLKKVAPMPPLLATPSAFSNDFEPLAATFNVMSEEELKGGDVLFFEGKPFRYLEHLDTLPPPPPPCPVMAAPSCVQQKPTNYASFPPRDTLQSLMRVDPQALMGAAAFNFRQMP